MQHLCVRLPLRICTPDKVPVSAQYNLFVASYHVENFGCRATQADGAAIERQLLAHGMERAGAAADAEVVVLNTCTVTASADKDVRASIRRIHRENPHAKILVTGCYAQRAPEELSALPGVSLVVGNSHKHQLAEYAAAAGERRTGLFRLRKSAAILG